MNLDEIKWMRYSIEIAKIKLSSFLQVGVLLISDNNELICFSYSGEDGNNSWSMNLLKKINEKNIFKAHSMYLTINTLEESFELLKIIRLVEIDKIYIGVPDPRLSSYFEEDPVVNLGNVYRYTDELQYKIIQQNKIFFEKSSQRLKYIPFYNKNRISSIIIENLKKRGLLISEDEFKKNKQETLLARLISNKYHIKYKEALSIVNDVISKSFNKKYATYNYSDDIRSLNPDWKETFLAFYNSISEVPLSANNILNVGVGSGNEAMQLFSDCKTITFVDIAQSGLRKIKSKLRYVNTLVANAEDLSAISDNSFNLYVSLRTYNSSFFDIKTAILEAKRVLKSNSIIIISVANGFLNTQKQSIISGLILPGTEFVDIYRGLDMIKSIKEGLIATGFVNIVILPTNTEIFISAIST